MKALDFFSTRLSNIAAWFRALPAWTVIPGGAPAARRLQGIATRIPRTAVGPGLPAPSNPQP